MTHIQYREKTWPQTCTQTHTHTHTQTHTHTHAHIHAHICLRTQSQPFSNIKSLFIYKYSV